MYFLPGEIALTSSQDKPRSPLSESTRNYLHSIYDSHLTSDREQLDNDFERDGLSAAWHEALRCEIDIPTSEATSIAIVDWTSIRNSCLLLEGVDPQDFQSMALDPFIALADLASVVAAVIFYDHVLVLTDPDWASRANRALGLQDEAPIASVNYNAGGPIQPLVRRDFAQALISLDRAEQEHAIWLDWLADAWSRLLPGITFPSHLEASYGSELGLFAFEFVGSFIGDEARPNALADIRDRDSLMSLFSRKDDMWRISESALPNIIRDNDLRALFYDNLAGSLSRVLSDDHRGPSVSYIGGCLRSPMLLARAKYSEAVLNDSTQVQNWLQSQWRLLYHPTSAPLRMPFWMDAILGSVRDRAGIAVAIRETRRSAKSLRKTRSRLDEALRIGDAKTIKQLMNVLKGDLRAATEPLSKVAGATGLTARVVGQSVLPVVPGEITGKAVEASLDSSSLRKLGLRLFRPHLRFVLSITSQAAEREKSITHAARIFNWPHAFAAEPLAFLERLTEVAWIA